jgi:hypothetical protein
METEQGQSEEDRNFKAPETDGQIEDADKAEYMARLEKAPREGSMEYSNVASALRNLAEASKYPGIRNELSKEADKWQERADKAAEVAGITRDVADQNYDNMKR